MLRTIHRNVKKSRGFTLVELMIVVAIVGILAALAIYGVKKYVSNSKTAEAKNSLGQMAKDAANAYNRDLMASAALAAGASTAVSHRFCDDAAAKVPAAIAAVTGKKYQSQQSEWDADNRLKGWQCVKFSMDQAQLYQYGYASSGITGADGETFTATAEGDLDGDATQSTFTLTGQINNQSVTISPVIDELNPEE